MVGGQVGGGSAVNAERLSFYLFACDGSPCPVVVGAGLPPLCFPSSFTVRASCLVACEYGLAECADLVPWHVTTRGGVSNGGGMEMPSLPNVFIRGGAYLSSDGHRRRSLPLLRR